MTACCACGGGSKPTEEQTVESDCSDAPNWKDVEGDTCETYGNAEFCLPNGQPGAGWQTEWGGLADYAVEDKDATQACCACGGGSSAGCKDQPGWYDSEGEGCLDYANNNYCKADGTTGDGWSSEWGSLELYATSGLAATSACCACGGGAGSAPTQQVCTDLIWRDAEGSNCAEYQSEQYCTHGGLQGVGWEPTWGKLEDYAVDGKSAIQACCACGGGSTSGGCVDAPDWSDSE